ncbi:MAG: hypothetical protein WDO06_02575 [Actinomycetota bacterium]
MACTQPTKAPKDLGTLVVAGRAEKCTGDSMGSEQGCFKKYGLTVKQELVASAAVSNAGMVSGSYDIIVTNPISVVQLMTNGDFGVKIVAPRYGYTAAQIARAKQEPLYPGELLMEVGLLVKKKFADQEFSKILKRKKIGVTTLQGATTRESYLESRQIMEILLWPQVLVLPSAQASAALQRGDVDAIAVAENHLHRKQFWMAREFLAIPVPIFINQAPQLFMRVQMRL